MRLVVVSGRSGSGKTVALHVLEDLGYYCVDNLPVNMMRELVDDVIGSVPALAVSVDVRNIAHHRAVLRNTITELKKDATLDVEIIYFDASLAVLLKRFSETRRKHPLTSNTVNLREAIAQEQEYLDVLADLADFSLDTSALTGHELRYMMQQRFVLAQQQRMQVLLQSFGFKYGLPPEADCVFDARFLPNPHWVKDLRESTGADDNVAAFLNAFDTVHDTLEHISQYVHFALEQMQKDNRSYLTIAVGCTGGRHRSVYLIEQLKQRLFPKYPELLVRHRDWKR